MVWRQLPKLIPAGSIPVSRSIKQARALRPLPLFCVARETGENDKRRKYGKNANFTPLVVRARQGFAPNGRK